VPDMQLKQQRTKIRTFSFGPSLPTDLTMTIVGKARDSRKSCRKETTWDN